MYNKKMKVKIQNNQPITINSVGRDILKNGSSSISINLSGTAIRVFTVICRISGLSYKLQCQNSFDIPKILKQLHLLTLKQS